MPLTPNSRSYVAAFNVKHLFQALNSPVKDYPHIMLQEIFYMALYDNDDTNPRTDAPQMSQRAYRDLTAFSQVCYEWRVAALGYPMLWARLPPVILRSPPVPWPESGETLPRVKAIKNIIERQKLYLERSNDAPVMLSVIIAQEYTHPDTPAELKDAVDELLELLLQNCHRWQSLFLDLGVEKLLALLADRKDLPVLRTLALYPRAIGPPFDDTDEEHRTLNFFSEAPDLKHVRIGGAALRRPHKGLHVELPWSQLETLEQSNYPDIPLLGKLAGATSPKLRRLRLEACTYQPLSTESGQKEKIVLRKLQELYLRSFNGATPGFNTRLPLDLSPFILPSLTKLEVGLCGLRSEVWLCTQMESLISRSQCGQSLRSLHIVNIPTQTIDSDYLRDILVLVPRLDSLGVSYLHDSIVDEMIWDDDDSLHARPILLPNLKVLKIQYTPGFPYIAHLNQGPPPRISESFATMLKWRSPLIVDELKHGYRPKAFVEEVLLVGGSGLTHLERDVQEMNTQEDSKKRAYWKTSFTFLARQIARDAGVMELTSMVEKDGFAFATAAPDFDVELHGRLGKFLTTLERIDVKQFNMFDAIHVSPQRLRCF